MMKDQVEILRTAFLYGLFKGIQGDVDGIDTTCRCCDQQMTFGDLEPVAGHEIRDLLEVHMVDVPPEDVANILADYFARGLDKPMDATQAIIAGFLVGEEAMDHARIMDLREDE